MAYGNFLENINSKFDSLFNEISAEYNFDNGPEFEIALCKVLRTILPNKYGICRGFVVSVDGQIAGDDIVIYDQERFPTLRLLQSSDYSQKQKIPIEAVYAYIEAKNTLTLEGEGDQSISKALSQIKAVKQITREKVPLTYINHQVNLDGLKISRPPDWPEYGNPLFTAIFSRGVRLKKNSPIVPVDEFLPELIKFSGIFTFSGLTTDLIIAGKDAIVIPAIQNSIASPFFIEEKSRLSVNKTNNTSFSIGIISMLYAFDYINLGAIHWPTILSEGLNLKMKD
jgi:hypothetical protein